VPRLFLLLLLLLTVASLIRLRSKRQGHSTAKWLPKDWPDALRQIALFALADVCYETVRGVAENNTAFAFENARSIVDLEKGLGLFIEPGFQSWAMGHRLLIDIANFAYVNSHFTVTTCALVWLYLRHNDRFYFVRNMFMVAMALALIGYVAMPTAPPRFFPELGIVDTIAYYADVRHDSAFVNLFFNPYAAVPSMHVAFALMLAVPCMLLVRRRVLKVLWAIYPAFVASVVIVTGNHWWFDGFVGACVAAVSALTAALVLARLRPAAWSWRPGPSTAQATA
jgi:membrane-associated phospholipid phosphatase